MFVCWAEEGRFHDPTHVDSPCIPKNAHNIASRFCIHVAIEIGRHYATGQYDRTVSRKSGVAQALNIMFICSVSDDRSSSLSYPQFPSEGFIFASTELGRPLLPLQASTLNVMFEENRSSVLVILVSDSNDSRYYPGRLGR